MEGKQVKGILVILFFSLFSVCFSQKPPGFILRKIVINGDTLPQLDLREVIVSSGLGFASEEEAKKYRRLVRDVRRVYPYAIWISVKVKEYDRKMASMDKREKKEFIKKIEPELKAQFEKAFKDNTAEQAQILIKLVDRETGHSSFQLIRQFKGGWSAFMWQSVARVVGTNLKSEYDPEGEDKNIELIVQQIEAGAY